MTSKFKVGDKVLIKKPTGYPTPGRERLYTTGCWTDEMDYLENTEVEICSFFQELGKYFYFVSAKRGRSERCLREDALNSLSVRVPRVHQKLIYAWADGAKIQRYDKPFMIYGRYNSYVSGGWKDVETPTWKDSAKYRLKPTKEMEELVELQKQKSDILSKMAALEKKIKGTEE